MSEGLTDLLSGAKVKRGSQLLVALFKSQRRVAFELVLLTCYKEVKDSKSRELADVELQRAQRRSDE